MRVFSDRHWRNWAAQFLLVAGLIAVFFVIADTAVTNLRLRGIPLGFEFLSMPSGMPIAESLIDYTPNNSYARAIFVGILNTLTVSILVVIASSVLGLFLGLMRLSSNPAISGAARVWVEIARNTPLVVILLFIYGIWTALPSIANAMQPIPGVFVSQRGIVFPAVSIAGGGLTFAVIVSAMVALLAASRIAAKIQDLKGKRPPIVAAVAGAIAIAFVAVYALGILDVRVEWPERRRFNFVGGIEISPEFATLITGLIFYTTGFIGEITRTGVLAVKRGYWEAASSLGLKRSQTLRLVVVPLALRVVVPPLNSQYINVVKNSTLAIAVGYQEFFTIAGTVINRTSHAIEGIALILLTYLVINLALSLMMNWYNRRLALVER